MTCFCHSGADEYVPSDVDVEALSRRFVAAAGGATSGAEAVILDGANHNCAQPPATGAEAFVRVVCRVLEKATCDA